jgi:GTP cyclohydrolase II
VGRGLAELRARRPVLIEGGDERLLALPVEGLNTERLAAFARLCAPQPLRLIITARRAGALGLVAGGPVALQLAPAIAVTTIHALVAEVKSYRTADAVPAGPAATAAIDLVKLVQLLPAVLVADATRAQTELLDPPVMRVETEAVARFRAEATRSLAIAGEALVPLSSGVNTRFVVFRDAFGDSPVAVVVGKPDPTKPVPVRLHSACLTGDVFGSRRCDCGDQLKLALARLGEAGGGVIIYLAQEGRGVGLANKMRTYQLQEAGLDTVDANIALGFDDDERDYGAAVRMLRILGYTRIVMLTNNPDKLDSLAKSGIDIVGRMPIEGAIHADNLRYLTAKATRNGHHLGHLLASLNDMPEANGHLTPLAP